MPDSTVYVSNLMAEPAAADTAILMTGRQARLYALPGAAHRKPSGGWLRLSYSGAG